MFGKQLLGDENSDYQDFGIIMWAFHYQAGSPKGYLCIKYSTLISYVTRVLNIGAFCQPGDPWATPQTLSHQTMLKVADVSKKPSHLYKMFISSDFMKNLAFR